MRAAILPAPLPVGACPVTPVLPRPAAAPDMHALEVVDLAARIEIEEGDRQRELAELAEWGGGPLAEVDIEIEFCDPCAEPAPEPRPTRASPRPSRTRKTTARDPHAEQRARDSERMFAPLDQLRAQTAAAERARIDAMARLASLTGATR